ncbi:hypothetical protein [Ramlibacter sp.]|uniref:hypothetical protein n=1 Tax=Ramlibacter sp. TaxID=1917967 RepID=UPI002B822C8A|nr:hypothetical protein [Ramlibacter sp.]HWI82658.1 hypothetical protein [Ramlibacter sp.]
MAGPVPAGRAQEQPVLWLGMTGFAPAQRKALETSIGRAAGSCRWRLSPFGDADGWWVNGAKCSLTGGNRLKIGPGLPTEHTLRLELGEVKRPLAFAKPLAPNNLEALCLFDPADDQSIHQALQRFEQWLLPVRARFVIGALLLQRESEERRGIYHLSQRGTLLAVLDFQQGQVAISPRAHPQHLWGATWERRPTAAGQTPPGFAVCTVTELAWNYVRRTDRDMLPPRYRTAAIYYRHVPRVPMNWLRDSQLVLLRELSTGSGTLRSLQERTRVPPEQLAHDLACLFYAGSVTTTPELASQPPDDVSNSLGLWPESAGPGEQSPPPRPRLDLTAPAMLERRPRRPPDGDELALS